MNVNNTAELVRADTALRSFRDAGYSFGDAVAEIIDNSIQAGARKIKMNWHFANVKIGKSPKTRREIQSLAIGDNGQGISPDILPNVLTIGFSTRYNNREGIGRFGVGFKLASISQAKRLEIYTRPAYLKSKQEEGKDGKKWVSEQPNTEGLIFMSYLDLDEIESGTQVNYSITRVKEFPKEYENLLANSETGTLIVWRKIDRMNDNKAFAESADEKIAELNYFLARTYRIYISNGINIYLPGSSASLDQFQEALVPYDPTFQIPNIIANNLAKGEDMKGELVEDGKISVDGYDVLWRVFLTPKVTRMIRGGGGEDGPAGDNQFKKLHIPDNQSRISFLRYSREVSYTKVPFFMPNDSIDKNRYLDRFIGIEIEFPPALDEYFQVKHIKRGIEPINKLKNELKKALEKPINNARKKIRKLWNESAKAETAAKGPENASGGRSHSEAIAGEADMGMPVSVGGQSVTSAQQDDALLKAAIDVGIIDPAKQEEFINQMKRKPIAALDMDWPGRSLLDIEHLNSTVVVKINRRHPFIKDIYLPLKEASEADIAQLDLDHIRHLFQTAKEGIDLLFFAYAKAESMARNPDERYMELREDFGKFAAVYLNKHEECNVG